MELISGASVTVISEEMWEKELGSVPLVESSATLKSYCGHAIDVVSETNVYVQYQTQWQVNLPIVVTKGEGLALVGRDWLSKLKLDWHQISNGNGNAFTVYNTLWGTLPDCFMAQFTIFLM